MAFEIKEFTNLGMDKDSVISKTEHTFAFDNHNIRLSSSNDSTVLSVTNERGPKPLSLDVVKYLRHNKISVVQDGFDVIITSEYPTQSDIYVSFYLNRVRNYGKFPAGSSRINFPSGYESNDEYEIDAVFIGYKEDSEFLYLSDEYFNYYSDDEASITEDAIAHVGISGNYVGHCIAGKYIVLFTQDSDNINYIYRLQIVDGKCTGVLLFRGDLNMKSTNPIETLYYYESEDVQKVYWTDNVNQPRFINIMSKCNYYRLTTQFDFTPVVNKLPKVKVSKNYNGVGLFPSGTIQYFVSYYNKFGAETGILFSTALQHLSFDDRGAKADEIVSCSFDITITDIDTSFDYARVYSAKRTSRNGPIELNIVADVPINSDKLVITDSNVAQETIDPNILYFIGGSSFLCGTMAQKNDTLFVGDITLIEDDLDSEVRKSISKALITEDSNKFKEANAIRFVHKCFTGPILESEYDYEQQIKYSNRMFKTFKRGEIYRFAIQFLSNIGKWTTPIWIGDKVCTVYPQYDLSENQIAVPDVEFTLPYSVRNIIANKYSKYRILMAETNYANRSIVAQGVVCPTMFNYEERYNNKPFSIASWIMRPRGGNASWEHLSDTGVNTSEDSEIQNLDSSAPPIVENVSNDGSSEAIAICVGLSKYKKIEIRVYSVISVDNYTASDMSTISDGAVLLKRVYENNSYWKDCYENLSNVFTSLGLNIGSYIDEDNFLEKTPTHSSVSGGIDNSFSGAWGVAGDVSKFHFYITKGVSGNVFDVYKKQKNFYIDNSIVTFHSPEIEEVQDIVDNSNLSFRIVGLVPITASYSDASLSVYNEGLSPYAKVSISSLSIPNFRGRAKTLITGKFYNDFAWEKKSSDFIYPSDEMMLYKVHMWQKEGSIVGQTKNTFKIDKDGNKEEFSTIAAELKDKLFATQRYSYNTDYIDYWNSGISRVSLFNSDELTIKNIRSSSGNLYYRGNYDKLSVADGGYLIDGNEYDREDVRHVSIRQEDPIRINYKTTPHAVFTLESGNGTFNILPRTKQEQAFKLENIYTDFDFSKIKDTKYPWDSYEITSDSKCIGLYSYKDDVDVEAQVIKHLETIVMNLIHEEEGIPELISKRKIFALVTKQSKTAPTSYYKILFPINTSTGIAIVENDKLIGNGVYETNPYNVEMIDFTTLESDQSNKVRLKNSFKVEGRNIIWNSITIYNEDELTKVDTPKYPYLYMAELYRNIPYNTLYGGYDENSIERINWIPISDSTDIYSVAKKMEGDTYYQRWDCLKTYPFTEESVNKVVDITSFMVESHINLDGRCDVNRGNDNLLNARPANFNLFNHAYSQDDNIFKYNILDSKFDLSRFSNQVSWSLSKSPTEDVDLWSGITLNSSLYLDGFYGGVTKLLNVNDNIVAFQEKGISTIQYNERIQISTESGAPVEIQNNNKVTGYNYVTNNYGCKNKFSIVPTKTGVYFIDELNKTFSKFSKDCIVDVSSQGMTSWFKNNDIQDLNAFYDGITHDIYLIDSNTCLAFNEDLNRFTSFFDYEGSCFLFNNEGSSFIYYDKFYEMFKGDYGVGLANRKMDYWIEYRINPEPYIDKTFTNIEFIADILNPGDDINSPHTESDKDVPFNKLDVWNSYQRGSSTLSRKLMGPLAKKFRIWRVQIPRDDNSKFKQDRIRSPWMHLRLSNDPTNKKMVFHNLIVKYFK